MKTCRGHFTPMKIGTDTGRTATSAKRTTSAGLIREDDEVRKNLTLEQRVHNAIGSQTCEDYKSRHAYLHTICYQREEFDVLWHKSPNTTWAHQLGRMVGWEENYYNHVIHTEISYTRIKSEMMKKYEILGGHDFRAVTSSGIHIIGSDVIEVAEDGMSVRASYLTPGTMTSHLSFDSDSKSGTWIWERYGSEFVFVDGEWIKVYELRFHEKIYEYNIIKNLYLDTYLTDIYFHNKQKAFRIHIDNENGIIINSLLIRFPGYCPPPEDILNKAGENGNKGKEIS